MRLVDRSIKLYKAVREIQNESFSGVENPPEMAFQYVFNNGDLFVRQRDTDPASPIVSFALVTQDAGHPFIWTLATTPRYRGYGSAGILLEDIARYLIGHHHERIDLTVKVDNPAQKLYFDHEFRVIKVLPRYYGEENGLRMRRML